MRGFAVLLLALLALTARAAHAQPKAELWERWAVHDDGAPRVLDHTLWERFLARHVVAGADGIHRVNYAGIDYEDTGYLRVYLDQLQRIPVSQLRRAEQFAFWVNLYNATTLKLALERYPLPSLRELHLSPGLFTKGPWGAKLIKVEGENLSLDDIRHRILRPVWQDARVHYALNGTALGDPNLAPLPYTAANTETLLETGARAFVNHPRGAHVENGKLRVSSLYHWYRDDFGADDAAVVDHLRRYAEPPLAARLDGIRRIAGHDYDWALNALR